MIVYLPIELLAREFDSKVLLAAELAARGVPVVLGQQWMVFENLERLPPGVVLFKSFNRIHQPAMAVARRAGHRVVALEEELLAQIEERAVVAMCAEGIFEAADLMLCNGRFEHDILARRAAGPAKLEICGNGRIDLLKPGLRSFFADDVARLRRAHGDFVLVNTNFSIHNSIWKSVEEVTRVQVQAGFVRPDDPRSVSTWQDYIDFERANIDAMHAAIRSLARRRPSQKIVVRPHPGEALERWHGVFADCPNVAVIREGSHVPWTLASRVLLHTSCTTGFEAQVAGIPALSLVPKQSWITDSLISNQVNPVFDDAERLVAAAEAILDGAAPPAPRSAARPVTDYVMNCGELQATPRIADLLLAGSPAPRPVTLPALQSRPRDERLKAKFAVTAAQCGEVFQRVARSLGRPQPRLQELGESLFLVAPVGAGTVQVSAPRPAPDYAALRSAIEGACQARDFRKAYELFRENFGEAHRRGELCFFVGIALFEMGDVALALQYFQQAALDSGAGLDFNLAFWMARAHHRLGEMEPALRYAEQVYAQVPLEQAFFDFLKEVRTRTGRPAPQHWLVIGCSHVRYFRYLQLNRARYFGDSVHLECYEFAGATAYGLGNAASESGALAATRKLAPRIARADRVLVNFGEIDCRRAAWKAAADTGRPVEELIGQAAERLEAYVSREILPHNRKAVLIGAKPQIIGDEDFYRNSLEDERTIFKPLAERERITFDFNARLKSAATRLRIGYADIDHVLADEASRRKFFRRAFWDTYTTDTHGNVDYFASLYFDRLRELI